MSDALTWQNKTEYELNMPYQAHPTVQRMLLQRVQGFIHQCSVTADKMCSGRIHHTGDPLKYAQFFPQMVFIVIYFYMDSRGALSCYSYLNWIQIQYNFFHSRLVKFNSVSDQSWWPCPLCKKPLSELITTNINNMTAHRHWTQASTHWTL